MAATPPTPVKQHIHISNQPITVNNWYKHINWFSTTLVLIIPTYGLLAIPYTPLYRSTLIWAFIYYFLTGFGITGGYHRLWSHRCYSARLPLRLLLAFVGAGAVQGSIRFWSSKHRAHHRWTDTKKDPYDALRGFFFSHLGWMLFNQDPKRIGRTDITDLDADPVVVWQHRHYGKTMMTAAWLFPMCVAGLGWGDWWGGLVYAGIVRACVVQQATFCVNSLAHWLGEQPFDDRRTPRDHFITALVTLGEGYHNFHHEFPSDYRNAISWYQYDPTKWSIYFLSTLPFHLAHSLKRFRHNEIEKGRFQQQQKALDARRSALDWGVPLGDLPVISWSEFRTTCQQYADGVAGGTALVAVAGVIHNVTDFIAEHPGGRTLIGSSVGKDATGLFNGGVYLHSNAAHNLLSTMRVGVLRGGQEVEVWKEEAMKKVKVLGAGEQVTVVRPLAEGAVAA
ncbi:hypothetical protein P280DRAFT_413492 [Massarina eburnea CBS 473.64]|uniref:Acyl-CoA desaturase n=1 Tax=Massarina eburnea CBS 473.64 TaxID=1395130 RepID=A0A6A6RKQ6_9PLEO|nr:hypothetical protein P280DRAFT_413492 [Massarina eburnea CBS 473.64]